MLVLFGSRWVFGFLFSFGFWCRVRFFARSRCGIVAAQLLETLSVADNASEQTTEIIIAIELGEQIAQLQSGFE